LPVPEELTVLRFHSPLVEPDVQISRIRLSDKRRQSQPADEHDLSERSRPELQLRCHD
jgi:hypothetical protein